MENGATLRSLTLLAVLSLMQLLAAACALGGCASGGPTSSGSFAMAGAGDSPTIAFESRGKVKRILTEDFEEDHLIPAPSTRVM